MRGYIKLYIIISAVIVSIASSLFLYNYGSNVGTQKAAKLKLKNELIQVKKENIKLSKANKELTNKIDDHKKDAQTLMEADSELKKAVKEIEDYQTKISSLKQELTNLNTPSELNSKYALQIQNVSNAQISNPVHYANTTLLVGEDIDPGRYCVKGNGNFRVINTINNNVTESQNVGLLESDSYTAIIEKNCKVIIDGALTFIEVN